ncbi:hypothetical protein M409DRAFT_24670 [Zasmidium cellare ATCC 36951]|uniref:Uncharacterized protein n=1 Tax=Zasmidium cellare ATCC 36951 TaxID=1080233 RepID=A0A6A6CCH3_ZASCE|nr:uncharacterized protein M409DRAFT_24670 [Zasmidium cellare ATCC 36951]KAF2164765.1 hypothetical protein M409DRAFT_24670 [Zasmidium cellare ATCC 36951]
MVGVNGALAADEARLMIADEGWLRFSMVEEGAPDRVSTDDVLAPLARLELVVRGKLLAVDDAGSSNVLDEFANVGGTVLAIRTVELGADDKLDLTAVLVDCNFSTGQPDVAAAAAAAGELEVIETEDSGNEAEGELLDDADINVVTPGLKIQVAAEDGWKVEELSTLGALGALGDVEG